MLKMHLILITSKASPSEEKHSEYIADFYKKKIMQELIAMMLALKTFLAIKYPTATMLIIKNLRMTKKTVLIFH